MSFLKDIVDFPSDSSSDEEEFVAPKRSLSRNPPIREKPGTIHRLSNLDETLRNMPYNQNYNTITHNGKSSQSSNSNQSVHRVRFSDTSTSNNNSDSRTNEIKKLEDKISRLQKIIKIKTDENRKIKSNYKKTIENNKEILKVNRQAKKEYQILESKIKELNITHENMNSFIKELRDLIKNHIGITINNESSNSKDQKKRKRPIRSSSVDEDLDKSSYSCELEEVDTEDVNDFPTNNIAPKDITSSIDLGNIISSKKRRRTNPVRFRDQTFKNF